MDPLPFVANQQHLSLMHDRLGQTMTALQQQNESGQFDSDDAQEQNLLLYGTQKYQEAHDLIRAIDDQLQSQLQAWDRDPQASKPVALALNSYQIKVLRQSLEQGMSQLNGNADERKLYESLMEQLPENSPQEDAD